MDKPPFPLTTGAALQSFDAWRQKWAPALKYLFD